MKMWKKRGYMLRKIGSLVEITDFGAKSWEFLGRVTLRKTLGENIEIAKVMIVAYLTGCHDTREQLDLPLYKRNVLIKASG